MSKSRFLISILFIAACFLFSGCAAKTPKQSAPRSTAETEPIPMPDPRDVLARAPAPGPLPMEYFEPKGETLPAFLKKSRKAQYFSSKVITTPPPKDMVDKYHLLLERGQAPITLADNVSGFVQKGEVLAMGLTDGKFKLYSGWPCSGGVLPFPDPVRTMAWEPESRYLLVTGGNKQSIFVFDVKLCGQVGRLDLNSTIENLAVSPKGSWMAAVDQTHRLWLGTPLGKKMMKVDNLRFVTLAIDFSPQEGILMAVDQAGWVVMWGTHTAKRMDYFQIKGGPFSKARFAGRRVELMDYSGNWQSWDMTTKTPQSFKPPKDRFMLKNNVLTYRTRNPVLMKKLLFGPAKLSAMASKSLGLIRVDDLDGKQRYYHAATGGQAPPPENSSDWTELDLDKGYKFEFGGSDYSLAVTMFQKDHFQLLCRHVPGKGYYLWWRESVRPGEYNPHPDSLPAKNGILKDSPVDWKSLNPDNDLP